MAKRTRDDRSDDTDVKRGGHRAAGVDELRTVCGMPPMGAYEGLTICLKCGEEFFSPNRRTIRICGGCKQGKSWTNGACSRLDSELPAIETDHTLDYRTTEERAKRKKVPPKCNGIKTAAIKRAREARREQKAHRFVDQTISPLGHDVFDNEDVDLRGVTVEGFGSPDRIY